MSDSNEDLYENLYPSFPAVENMSVYYSFFEALKEQMFLMYLLDLRYKSELGEELELFLRRDNFMDVFNVYDVSDYFDVDGNREPYFSGTKGAFHNVLTKNGAFGE
jgi:hypothetical protein